MGKVKPRTYGNGEELQPADLYGYIAQDFKPRKVELILSETHPYVIARFPESFRRWGMIRLAPLYDVQFGHRCCDEKKFDRHVKWIKDNPEVFTWLGGDAIDWNTKLSIGAGVYEQKWNPDNQIIRLAKKLAAIRDRILFAIPGNHERRGALVGIDAARWYSSLLQIPYFNEPVFLDIDWCGRTTAVYAWHGRGAARTEGAITNVTMEPLHFTDVDLAWCGHLHRPRFIPTIRLVRHPETLEIEEREVGATMSPSYFYYFGSYATDKGLPPSPRGLVVADIYPNGTWQVQARGRKFL